MNQQATNQPIYPGLSKARLLWLVQLRWLALAGVTGGTIVAAAGVNPGINLPVLVTSLVAGVMFNLYFLRQVHTSQLTATDGTLQVLVDIGALTLVLWAGGGPDVPFQHFYFFHIIIGGILVGPRAAIITAGVAVFAVAFLEMSRFIPALHISTWQLPGPGWQRGINLLGLGVTVTFLAYFVTHIMNDLHSQLRAVAEQRERASNALARLTFTLDRMDAGMEVLDHQGHRIWFNQTFQKLFPENELGALWGCPGTSPGCAEGGCPVAQTFGAVEPHRCMLNVGGAGSSRAVYELISYPLSSDRTAPQVMNLYLNRTHETALQRRVDQAERLAAFGRLAQGLAHELGTPLGTVHALAGDISEVVATTEINQTDHPQIAAALADIDESCRIVQDEARRCRSITTTLLSGRDLYGEDHRRPVDIRQLIDHSCILTFGGDESRPTVKITAPADLSLMTDPDRLLQVLLNVLRNAQDAAGSNGQIRVVAEEDGRGALITITDSGPGITAEVAERMFEPFFTTKDPGQGTGLGLYTCYLIIQRLGGQIEIENATEGGAQVKIWMPTQAASSWADSKPSAQQGTRS